MKKQEAIDALVEAAEKFLLKVESGLARSHETYAELRAATDAYWSAVDAEQRSPDVPLEVILT